MASKYLPAAAEAASEHPRIRAWMTYREKAGGDIRVQVWRERQAFGAGPPVLHVEFLDRNGAIARDSEAPWSADLDDWLVDQSAKAITPAAEALRFSLRLKDGFAPLWKEWGDGYFNAVLYHAMSEGLPHDASVRAVLSVIVSYRAHDGGSLHQRIADVDTVVSARARELNRSLGYDEPTTMSILGAAVATYLSDRFHVGDRHRLFGTRGTSISAKKIAALSLANVLERVLRAEGGGTPSSYFYGAQSNIEEGDDVSVDVNWPHIVKAIGDALPEGFVRTETKDRIRETLEIKLAAHGPEVVDAACDLLADTIGGDSNTYRRLWGRR